MNNQLIFLLNQLAKKNNISLDNEEAKIQLLSHPYYPSINSITDLFNHFGIDNLAMFVENTSEVFMQLPDVFLAQINEEKNDQLIVVVKNQNYVELIYDEKLSKKISIDAFFKIWSGIIVLIEKPKNKIKRESNTKNKIKNFIITITILLFGSVFLSAKPSLFQIIHFSLSCIGIYISYLIVQHELGQHSKILDKFCSGQSKKTDCSAVLSSKGATIFGLFKLSDVGLVYFFTLLMTWLIIAINGFSDISVIFLISTLVVPFTFYSIYYQWKIVKGWCPLCLSIVTILWLQFGSLFFKTSFWLGLVNIDLSYVYILESLLMVTSLWIIMQPLLKKEKQLEKLEIEHIKFKRNFTLFKAALNLNSPIETSIKEVNEIVFGNTQTDVPFKLVVVTNPMCGHCKESHNLIKSILKKDYLDIQITVRFNVRPNDVGDIGTKVAAKLLEIFQITNKENCLKALSDIYGEMDAGTWLKKWGETSDETYFKILKQQKEWCNDNKINFTPAILINGKQYPKEYDRMDLLYFIDDIIEEQVELGITQPEMMNS